MLCDLGTLVGSTRSFRAMGTTVNVIVVVEPGAPRRAGGLDDLAGALHDRARSLIEDAESRLSRFLPDSEIARLNAAGGAPVAVDPRTVRLLTLALDAWRSTDGGFCPFLGNEIAALGYATSRTTTLDDGSAGWDASLREPAPTTTRRSLDPASDIALSIDDRTNLVHLRADIRIDLGGIAKGFTADDVAGELLAAGAVGALVDIGGDIAVAGRPETGDGWVIDVEHPLTGASVGAIELIAGGIATSSPSKRRWRSSDGGALHHLLDPATGTSVPCPFVAVTAVAGTAAEAEILTKDVIVAASWPDDLPDGVELLTVELDGSVARTPAWFDLPPGDPDVA